MCRVQGVSPSGSYAWRARPLSRRARTDVKLSAEIQAIHRESRGSYSMPRTSSESRSHRVFMGLRPVAIEDGP
jgi:putative transposase